MARNTSHHIIFLIVFLIVHSEVMLHCWRKKSGPECLSYIPAEDFENFSKIVLKQKKKKVQTVNNFLTLTLSDV
jgi:hypothetical protein